MNPLNRVPRRAGSAAITLVLAGLVAGCGGPGPQASRPAVAARAPTPDLAARADWPDPCKLVTRDEVAVALGGPVASVNANVVPGDSHTLPESVCEFDRGTPDERGAAVLLVVGVSHERLTRDAFAAFIDDIKSVLETHPVAGVGDVGYFVIAHANDTQWLELLKGDVHFTLSSLDSMPGQRGQTEPVPAVRTLAIQAASRVSG